MVIQPLHDSLPIRFTIYGGELTWKSTLTKAIVRSAVKIINDKVVRLISPNGVDAFNIGGSTIHHELSILVNQYLLPIIGDHTLKMQEDFSQTKLIIIMNTTY